MLEMAKYEVMATSKNSARITSFKLNGSLPPERIVKMLERLVPLRFKEGGFRFCYIKSVSNGHKNGRGP